ncbi:hypothetical protein PAAG_11869 [Paracoccidioides lutzii Pb01]|uniref:Uncharacterized protein n=1 Tax=Paracoccidioides lutzii (strain ATCC MYA-826 / Pb01) TaxID=502779 RepID=A0A0A2V5H8_PARBA|nr:hypothetical protein PAAG_11869 [Paracoccidioides lutzii Pb01]KGQ01405.1 hypothetical protein PAAG_11869 [Paracoccidioides lutzii Pb01]
MREIVRKKSKRTENGNPKRYEKRNRRETNRERKRTWKNERLAQKEANTSSIHPEDPRSGERELVEPWQHHSQASGPGIFLAGPPRLDKRVTGVQRKSSHFALHQSNTARNNIIHHFVEDSEMIAWQRLEKSALVNGSDSLAQKGVT